MIIEEIKNIQSERKDLRSFGLVVGSVFAALGIYSLIWGSGLRWPVVLGVLLILFGVVFPSALKPFQKAWMALAVLLGWLMTRIILLLVFFAVITPLGLLMRLLGKRPLALDYGRGAQSYWTRREQNNDKNRYLKQY